MTKNDYESYFEEPGTLKARYLRYAKTNLGVKGNKRKLFRLLDKMPFCNISEADNLIDWSNAPQLTI